jgi:hypothetical protein
MMTIGDCKRFATVFAVLLLGSGVIAQEVKPLVLEDGTPVKLVLDQTVSSETSHTGDLVSFEVVEDVSVSGVLVIPRGSIAWATVTAAEHKRRMGRGGKLDMNLDKVRLADGEKVLLRSVQGGKGGGHTGGMVTGIVVTSLVLWPAAPLFLLMHGKDITIPKGTAITAFTQGDAVLDAAKFTPDNLHPAPAAVSSSALAIVTPAPQAMQIDPQQESQTESLGDASRRMKTERAAQQKPPTQ